MEKNTLYSGALLRKYRRRADLLQRDVADYTGLNVDTIGRYELKGFPASVKKKTLIRYVSV